MTYPQAEILKTNKRLLLCPFCEERGRKEILGELDEDGNLIVMRFKGEGKNGKTKIVSNAFEVMCGVCNEIVFYRKEVK